MLHYISCAGWPQEGHGSRATRRRFRPIVDSAAFSDGSSWRDVQGKARQAAAWARLGGLAGVHLASALRVGGDLNSSDRAFSRAGELWRAGAADDPGLLNAARVLHLSARPGSSSRRSVGIACTCAAPTGVVVGSTVSAASR